MELTINKVNKKYGKKVAVDNVSAKLQPGITALLGANGSGKTTLMRILVDVLKADSGTVLWNGKDIQDSMDDYLSCLGYLPQHMGDYPSFKVDQFLEYMGALKGLKLEYIKQRIDYLLKELHLEAQRKKKIKTLSGGMKQRLKIAQALLNDPSVLILDEPTVGLDPKERNQFSMMLSTLSQDKIILLSTHIVSDIENIANKVLLMKDGEFIDYNHPEKLLSELKGMVFEKQVTIDELNKIVNRIIICNQRNNGNNIVIRFISEEIIEGACEVTPTLSDLYLYHFKGVSE